MSEWVEDQANPLLAAEGVGLGSGGCGITHINSFSHTSFWNRRHKMNKMGDYRYLGFQLIQGNTGKQRREKSRTNTQITSQMEKVRLWCACMYVFVCVCVCVEERTNERTNKQHEGEWTECSLPHPHTSIPFGGKKTLTELEFEQGDRERNKRRRRSQNSASTNRNRIPKQKKECVNFNEQQINIEYQCYYWGGTRSWRILRGYLVGANNSCCCSS